MWLGKHSIKRLPMGLIGHSSIARNRNTIIPAKKRHFWVGLKGIEMKQNKRKLLYF